jgi:lipopolysaccharide assembly outer membrane protein LptD (OstA)
MNSSETGFEKLNAKNNKVTVANDTIPPNSADTTIQNTVDTFSFKISPGALTAPVAYHADDSMVMDIPQQNIKLYGKKSTVKYADNDLEAPHIEFDQKNNLLSAHLSKDSNGKVIAYPQFVQKDFKTQSDTIEFNLKSQKGLTKGTYTQQGEMYVYGETIKKVDKDVFYALRGRFTTCNLDTPHFAFVSNKIKFIQNKMAFTGPVHPEFEGVPVPIILPFGIYPLSQGRHSGLLAPSFSANGQMGLALEGLGYYKILNPTWDATLRGTIYSYGGWTASLAPRYFKRYHYQGSVGLNLQRFKTNFKGDPDFTSSKTYNFTWNHSLDSKVRPGVSFNASVNLASSKFNEQVPNNATKNFTNQMNSSITYSKVWKDKPFNLSIGANHNQNTIERRIYLNLPDIAFNVNTLYPFRRKEPIGEYSWYENLGIALNSNIRSLTSFYDTAGNIGKQMKDHLQWGASHNVPISLSLPQMGAFQIAPNISYSEKWYDRQFVRSWDTALKKVDTAIHKGFYRASDISYGISASTRIFGMFTFNKGRIKAIRHEIRPSISLNYTPDMNSKNYYSSQVDTSGRKFRFSKYEGSIFGVYPEGKFGGLSFGIDNNLSMKILDKKDTSAGAIKKVTILDGFGITSSYNFLIDSFKMAPLNVSARSNLFEKVSITANAIFDPYQKDSLGERIDQLIWKKKILSLGTLMAGSISMQTSFKGGDKTKASQNNNNNLNQQSLNNSGMPLDEYQQELAYMNNNPGEFVDFSIPWDISFSYSLRFNRVRKADYRGYTTTFNQDVNWNSSFNLAPKWKIGVTGFYNITAKELGTISMFLSREMHCWQMAINISPVGKYKYFNISLSPKSALLRDLKVNRTRSFVDM